MNPNQKTENEEQLAEEVAMEDAASVDDFIKELEAKEKDLHISSDWTMEISEADFDDKNIPDFVLEELAANGTQSVEPVQAKAVSAVAVSYGSPENEIAELRNQIAGLEAERTELLEKSLRRLKDFETYKNRMDRERHETFVSQISNLAKQMLPALDNLNRALDSALELPEEKLLEIRQFFEGIVLVNQQVNEVFAGMGVMPITPVGEVFDPHFHEAVATEENDNLAPNTVSQELLRGYRIGNKVIRHSMVKVATSSRSNGSVSTPESLNSEAADLNAESYADTTDSNSEQL